MQIDEFKKELDILGIKYNENQLIQLEQYYQLLIEWNKKMNLTAITEKEQIYLKHFYDSLTLVKIINLKEQETLCDIGTGAGFPGIVIKIFFPNLKIKLVDSLQKRTLFLKNVIDVLHLENIEVYNARAEEYALNNREKYDIVTARAVSHLRILLEYGIPMVKVGKYLVAMKGNIEMELRESRSTIEKLNCEQLNEISFDLPFDAGHRTLLMFQKHKKTSTLFPRKYSEIKKKSL